MLSYYCRSEVIQISLWIWGQRNMKTRKIVLKIFHYIKVVVNKTTNLCKRLYRSSIFVYKQYKINTKHSKFTFTFILVILLTIFFSVLQNLGLFTLLQNFLLSTYLFFHLIWNIEINNLQCTNRVFWKTCANVKIHII